MTAQVETRFDCDRCDVTINVPLQNTPVNQRAPDGWAVMVIDGERTVHLCGDCAVGFRAFLNDRPTPSLVGDYEKIAT